MVTLDGFFEGPNHELDWHNVDAEFNEFAIEQLKTIDTILFGRATYQMMASYWPTPVALSNDPIVANLMNNMSKVVFSKTLQKAEWQNTRLVKDNLKAEILKVKQQPSSSNQELAVFGSANLLATLMELDLIDEHRIMVNPVVLGQGNPLFSRNSGYKRTPLKLLRTQTFRSGNVLLCYGV
jgi:dihydrofolate reductase